MAITQEQRIDLIEMYVAIPGRAPDADGLAFWAGKLEEGVSFDEIAQAMWDSAEAQALYPASLTAEETVTRIYQNVLGREPDQEGLDFWIGRWNANGVGNEGATLLEMIDAINNYSGTDQEALDAQQLFLDKVEFGEWFAIDLGSNDLDLAALGFEVLEEGGSVADAQEAVQLDPAGSYILTNGTDSIDGGNNDDTFFSTESTLDTSDSLDGGDGHDVLEVDVESSGNDFISAPTLDNIELITVTEGGSQTLSGFIDLSDSDFNDVITLETNENRELDWSWEDIQSVNNTFLRVIDTDEGWIGFGYDVNAYDDAALDVADLTVAEVDCLHVDFYNTTNNQQWSDINVVNLHSLTNGQVSDTDFNYLYQLHVGYSFTTLNIDGDADLTIEKVINDIGGGNTVTMIDASGLDADLNIDVEGQGATTGVIGDLGAARIAPITIIGAQGDDDIDVDSGEPGGNGRNGVNGVYDLGTGNDALGIGDFEGENGPYWDGEDCHDDDTDYLSCPSDFGDSTVSLGEGNDSLLLALNGEQSVDGGTGDDLIQILGDTDDILTSASGDGQSTVDAGDGDDAVYLAGDLAEYNVTLGDGADTLDIDGCGEDCGEGDQTVDAGAGNDVVSISMIGDHEVDGGDGDDILSVGCDCDEEGNNTIDAGAGNDIVDVWAWGIQDITLGAGNDILAIHGDWVGGNEFDYGDDVITTVDAGEGNDDVTFYLNHFMDVDLGDGNDVLTMRAEDLTADDAINGGDGVDTVVLYNDGDDSCDTLSEGCLDADRVAVTDSETSSSQGIEVFDLRNSGIELHLTTDLFDTAEDNDITVITEKAGDSHVLPTLTLLNGAGSGDDEVVSVFSQGMTREDWESIVEDWEDGLYAESDGTPTESELIDYIRSKGVSAVDFDDTNDDGDDYLADHNGSTPPDPNQPSDDEDQVFFRWDDDCDMIVDVTETPLTAVNGRNFTLLGGTIRDIVVADDPAINGRMTLRFDSAGGDADSVEDTLVVTGDQETVTITAADLRNVSGMECILLKSTANNGVTWNIELTDNVINQTTGNAELVIWVDPQVPAGSILNITTDDTTQNATNGVKIMGNSQVTVYIDGVVQGDGDNVGLIEVETQFIFTDNNDDFNGGSGADIFYAVSADDIEHGDHADGNGSCEDELVLGFSVFNGNESLVDQLDNPDLSDIEILRFVLPGSGSKTIGDQVTNQAVRMDSIDHGGTFGEDLQEVHTGNGDDDLSDMEGGIEYNLYDGDDYLWIGHEGEDCYGEDTWDTTVYAGNGEDYVRTSGGDDLIVGGNGADTLHGEEGNDDIYGGSGNDSISGASGDDYLSGGEGNDTIRDWGSGQDTIYGGDGDDYIHDDSGDDSIVGGQGDDSIIDHGSGQDHIWGGDGADTIESGSGDDYVYGGSGADYIEDEYGDDTISGGEGNDSIWDSGSGDDSITGGDGDDYINSGSGDDLVGAGSGDDYVEIGGSFDSGDTLDGGDGEDTLHFEDDDDMDDNDFAFVSRFEVLDLTDQSTNDVQGGDNFHDAGFTTVLGGSGNDTLDFFDVNGDRDLFIDADAFGGSGNDTVIGGAGDDTILLGDGSDTVQGSAGADSIDLGDDGDDNVDDYVFFVSPNDGGAAGDFSGYDIIDNFDDSEDEIWIDGALADALGDNDEDQDAVIDADDTEIAIFTQAYQSLTDADLLDEATIVNFLQSNITNVDAGDAMVIMIQGDNDTALYFFLSDDDPDNIDASEVQMLGLFTDTHLDQYDIQGTT